MIVVDFLLLTRHKKIKITDEGKIKRYKKKKKKGKNMIVIYKRQCKGSQLVVIVSYILVSFCGLFSTT